MEVKLWSQKQITAIIDAAKHMTTLSTGSILLIIAFYEKANKTGAGKLFIVSSIILFVTTIITSVFTIFSCINLIDSNTNEAVLNPTDTSIQDFLTSISQSIAYITFIAGIISVCIYGIINF